MTLCSQSSYVHLEDKYYICLIRCLVYGIGTKATQLITLAVISQGNYLIKHQHIFAYVSAHAAYISVGISAKVFIFRSVWEITYLRLCKRNILTLDHAVARTGYIDYYLYIVRKKLAGYIECHVGSKLCMI